MARWAAMSLMLLLSGCAMYRPYATPAEGGYPWFEVQTEHFLVRSNLDRASAVETARKLERLRDALVLYVGIDPPVRVDVVHLRSGAELDQFQPGQWSGFATTYGGRPLLITTEDAFVAGTDMLTTDPEANLNAAFALGATGKC